MFCERRETETERERERGGELQRKKENNYYEPHLE